MGTRIQLTGHLEVASVSNKASGCDILALP